MIKRTKPIECNTEFLVFRDGQLLWTEKPINRKEICQCLRWRKDVDIDLVAAHKELEEEYWRKGEEAMKDNKLPK